MLTGKTLDTHPLIPTIPQASILCVFCCQYQFLTTAAHPIHSIVARPYYLFLVQDCFSSQFGMLQNHHLRGCCLVEIAFEGQEGGV